jgi:hypothetical protein
MPMLIQVYLVESHRHGSIDDLQPASSPVGAVQFIGNIAQERGEEVAMELLSRFSPLTHHPILGAERWEAELTSVEDDSLGLPSFEDASKGYRMWLPAA